MIILFFALMVKTLGLINIVFLGTSHEFSFIREVTGIVSVCNK